MRFATQVWAPHGTKRSIYKFAWLPREVKMMNGDTQVGTCLVWLGSYIAREIFIYGREWIPLDNIVYCRKY